jgi:hypothetical protein
MAKQSGLGDNLYVGGYDLSGDIGSLSTIGGGPAAIEVTGINKSAKERLGGLRDGTLEYMAFFNKAAGHAHPVLSALPRTDVLTTYCRGTTLGKAAACMIGKQMDYAPSRSDKGELTIKVTASANGYGLEWGQQLTAGLRTDVAAANGASLDGGAATSFGFQAYLQCTAFTGTDVTVRLEDSADNVSFAAVASGAFTQITGGAPLTQRIAVGGAATLRRYVRASTITTGGVTSVTFSVVVIRNKTAVSF